MEPVRPGRKLDWWTAQVRRCILNAVRIRKTLGSLIPELPELSPLVGKTVEIIVLEEGGAETSPTFWESPDVEQLRIAQAVSPGSTLDVLIGGWPEKTDDGLDEDGEIAGRYVARDGDDLPLPPGSPRALSVRAHAAPLRNSTTFTVSNTMVRSKNTDRCWM